MNFMINSGSFFIFMGSILFNNFIKFVCFRCVKKFPKSNRVRKLNIYLDSSNIEFKSPLIKLNLEMYFDILMAAFMQIYAFYLMKNEFSEFFSSFSDFLSSALCFIYLIVLIPMPLKMKKVIKLAFDKNRLESEEFTSNYSIYIDSVKTTNLHSLLFNYYFVCRRFIMAFVLIYMEGYPFFQCTLFTVMSIINLIYMWTCKPLDS